MGDADVLRLLESPASGFSWFVTTTPALAAEKMASLRTPSDPDAVTAKYEFENERTPSSLVEQLRRKHPELRRDGFLFFDLRRPR